MSIEIRFDPHAVRDLKRLWAADQRGVELALVTAAARPARHFRRLKGSTASRPRVGDLRIIADVIADKELIFVHLIGHRRNVYG